MISLFIEIALGIVALILSRSYKSGEEPNRFFAVVLVLMLMNPFLSYSIGYIESPNINKRQREYLEHDRESCIEAYELCPCERDYYILVSYNSMVEIGNNLFCRFKVEDRSQYKIDIDEVVKENKYES